MSVKKQHKIVKVSEPTEYSIKAALGYLIEESERINNFAQMAILQHAYHCLECCQDNASLNVLNSSDWAVTLDFFRAVSHLSKVEIETLLKAIEYMDNSSIN